MFDALAINVDGPRAWDLDVAVDVTFLDTGDNYRLTLRNGVLVHRRVSADGASAQATIRLAHKLRLLAYAGGDTTSPGVEITGDEAALANIVSVLDRPDPAFNIITP
jgi:alkyl sulfatase BDS1-like metallo-beta-lactamase superfamily hydrolase